MNWYFQKNESTVKPAEVYECNLIRNSIWCFYLPWEMVKVSVFTEKEKSASLKFTPFWIFDTSRVKIVKLILRNSSKTSPKVLKRGPEKWRLDVPFLFTQKDCTRKKKKESFFAFFSACTRRWWWRFSHYSRFCGRRTVSGLMRNIKKSQILIREKYLAHLSSQKKKTLVSHMEKLKDFRQEGCWF